LKADELLTLDADTLLRRLFWEEPHTRYEPVTPRFACSCSRERVRRMLVGLGAQESESLVAERGHVEVGCEFCGQQYRFDAVDVGEMFAPPAAQVPGTSSLN
jgi:molecular chaperone Hsp33